MLNDYINHIKLILLGDTGVGKSAIIQRYYNDVFDENSGSTCSANFYEKEVIIRKKKIILELWDTAGQEEYKSMTQIFVKNAKIIILVYDITSSKTFQSLNYWHNFINKELGPNVILGLAGNKTDLIFDDNYEEEVTPEQGKKYADKIGASFACISAKESANEIINLFNELVIRYLDYKGNDRDLSSTIKLDNRSFTREVDKENECCLGKNKKTIKLNAIFLGCNGVGKTSIIKAIKGKDDIYHLPHTNKEYKETIYYKRGDNYITAKLEEINVDSNIVENINKDNSGYKIFFLVFNIYEKNTLYSLESYISIIDREKNKVYLLGYYNEAIENKNSEFNPTNEVEIFAKKYKVEYEFINIEDIYKVKAIIIDNIGIYLSSLGL